jgi:GMP synthase (glutamine-hydrolysing)
VQERRVARLDAPNPLSPPLVAVLGGPIGAYDEASYPSISPLLKLIETRIAAGLPTLGICLRAQLIVRALGARVYPAAQREIGWTRLTLTDAGRASALRHLDGGITSMLHWHGDTFDLPSGATLLASTPACAHDARRNPDPTRLSGDESRVRAPRRVDALS